MQHKADWGQGTKGAAGGAMTGAAIGSVIAPGLGTALGAIGGGLLGGLGSLYGGDPTEEYRRQLQAYADMARNRQAPQMGPAAQGVNSGFRENQANLIAMLEAQARGEGPSLAAQQLRQATDQGTAQAQALAASGRGPNAALAQFQAQNVAGQLAAQNAQQAMAGRIQEQFNAQQQLGWNVQAGRGADEAMSMFNAGQMNDAQRANLMAKLQAMGLNDQAVLQALGMAGGMAVQPGMGDQLFAGGVGSLGFLAAQLGQKKTQTT